jgi:hypothetical protein
MSVTNAQEPKLRGLRYLPSIFRWTRLAMRRFNRKLDRAQARALTVGEAIATLPNGTYVCVRACVWVVLTAPTQYMLCTKGCLCSFATYRARAERVEGGL